MKNKKLLILLIVLFIVLIGIYFGVTFISKEDGNNLSETTTADNSVQLLNIAPEDVSEIRLVNSYGDKTYFRDENNTWRVRGDEEADIAQSLLNRMATNGGALTAITKVEETSNNLEKYKLDVPGYEISLRQYNGDEHTFYIGMQNQVTSEYYMYVKDVDGIYTVAQNFPGFFNYGQKELYYFIDVLTTSEITYIREISMEYGDNVWHLIKNDEVNEADLSGMRAWYLTGLYEDDVAADTGVLQGILEQIIEFELYSCEVFSSAEEKLDEVGLAPGKCKGSIYYYFEEVAEGEELNENTVVGSQKIWIGNKTEDDMFYYVRPDGRDGIYLMYASYLDSILAISTESLLQKFVSLINIGILDSYVIEMDGITHETVVKSKKENDTVTYHHYHNGKEVQNGEGLYIALVDMYAEKALVEKEKPSGEELLKITFNVDSDKIPIYEVAFYEYSVNYYKVAINGEVSYWVNARDYKTLVETISSFIENITYVTEE